MPLDQRCLEGSGRLHHRHDVLLRPTEKAFVPCALTASALQVASFIATQDTIWSALQVKMDHRCG